MKSAGAQLPFWSPDGRQIAFRSEARLRRIPISGGSSQIICDVKKEMRGGVWLKDGTILFSVIGSPLYRVSAEGGEPKPLTELNVSANERGHYWPVLLPDSKHFLYVADKSDPMARSIYLAPLDSKERTELMKTPFMATCCYLLQNARYLRSLLHPITTVSLFLLCRAMPDPSRSV